MTPKIHALLATFAALFLVSCGNTVNPADRALLQSQSQATLNDFKSQDPTLEHLLNEAHAYVIFPRIIAGAIGVGGAHGDGEVYQKGKLVGYADVSQATIGLQIGEEKFAELILFRNEGPFADFTHSTYEIDARASAVAAASGAASTADYSRGVLVFTMPESGLMAQAALGVQKFRYTEEKH